VDYRKKYYEYSITIATALLAFSISFPPALTAVHCVFLVRIAWIALGISILCASPFTSLGRPFSSHSSKALLRTSDGSKAY